MSQTGMSQSGSGTSLQSSNLAEILERVLDKGIVIAGDIKVKLVDIELLTIELRLVLCSVDKAKEIGIDWWNRPPLEDSENPLDALTGHEQWINQGIRRLENAGAPAQSNDLAGNNTNQKQSEVKAVMEIDVLKQLDDRIGASLDRIQQLQSENEQLAQRLAESEQRFDEINARLREQEEVPNQIKSRIESLLARFDGLDLG